MWDPDSVWEIPQCPIGGILYFTRVISVYESNEIGMHLLNVEENDTYVFDLGTVLIATFQWGETFRNAPGSSGTSQDVGRLPDYLATNMFRRITRPNTDRRRPRCRNSEPLSCSLAWSRCSVGR